jgi:hypothetical protein
MNSKMKKVLIFCIVGAFVFSVCCVNALSTKTNNIEKTIKSMHHGSAGFCILMIDTKNAEGLPDELYTGILTDINVTLDGPNQFMLTPIPWILLTTMFDTNETIHLEADFFWGFIDPTYDPSQIMGFAKNVKWEW